jgi:hypothetical protein
LERNVRLERNVSKLLANKRLSGSALDATEDTVWTVVNTTTEVELSLVAGTK